jgi:hypothetical protein
VEPEERAEPEEQAEPEQRVEPEERAEPEEQAEPEQRAEPAGRRHWQRWLHLSVIGISSEYFKGGGGGSFTVKKTWSTLCMYIFIFIKDKDANVSSKVIRRITF